MTRKWPNRILIGLTEEQLAGWRRDISPEALLQLGGANLPVPVRLEETLTGFEYLQREKAERQYDRYVARMKQLGLLSNPGDIEQIYSEQFSRIGGWWETIWGSLTDLIKWIVENPETVGSILETLVKYGVITPDEKGGMEGLTKEQIAAMIEAKIGAAPTWQTYLPWIAAGGLGIGLILVLALRRSVPIYVGK